MLSKVLDFETIEAENEPMNIDSLLCHLPYGSGTVCANIINDRLDGPSFRNSLRLLREELIIGTLQVAQHQIESVRRQIATLNLDNTRFELVALILDYLSGSQAGFSGVCDLLEGEEIVPANFLKNVTPLKVG